MSYEFITVHTEADKVGVITLNRPKQLQALNAGLMVELGQALKDFDANEAIGCMVITGSEKAFAAGADIGAMATYSFADVYKNDYITRDWETIRSIRKPVIAAVEGAAAGAGFSLVLACDLVVASTESLFVMAYTSVGLSPDGGGSWFLSRALPKALVNQFMLLGERIPAQRLADAGLINHIAPTGEALTQALALAEKINQRAPNALASIKELTEAAYSQDVFAHMHTEKQHFLKNLNHVNAGIGIQAFLDKQTPQYKP